MTCPLWIALLVGAIGCGSPQPPPPPPHPGSAIVTGDAAPAVAEPLDHDLYKLAERSVKLYQDVVHTFEAAGEDCAAAAGKLADLQRTYADVVAANAKVLHDGRAQNLKVALKHYDDQLDAAAHSIMASKTLAKCSTDAAFAQAFDLLVGAPP
jgi:hypothetical protein